MTLEKEKIMDADFTEEIPRPAPPKIEYKAGTEMEKYQAGNGTLADPYLDMNSRDDAMIIAEALGQFSEEYIYKYDIGGKPIRGLSFCGVKEARRLYKMIVVKIVDIIETDQYYQCKAQALDRITGSATEVCYRESKWKKRRDKSLYADEHAFMKCQSKAKRNAISELLPQELIRGWFDDYEAGKKFDPERAKKYHKGTAVDNEEGEPASAPVNWSKFDDACKAMRACKDLKLLATVSNDWYKSAPNSDWKSKIIVIKDECKEALAVREPGAEG